jgi:hypothetical protein
MALNRSKLRNKYARVALRMCAGMLMLAVWPGHPIQAQEASPVHVYVAFDSALSPRFTTNAQSAVESELAASLAAVCANSDSLRHWTYDSTGDGLPKFQVSVFPRNGSYFLRVELKHKPTATAVTDRWEAELFSPEHLSARGLPMNLNWLAPVKAAFQGLLAPTSRPGREIFKALQSYVPLGTSVVMVPPEVAEGQPASVLPLAWEHYQDIATCHFLILFRKPTMLITLHASGTGGPLDFTPDAPHYKAIWVIHDSWQMGASAPVKIAEHLNDLAHLSGVPSEFYLDSSECSPAGLSLASN